jgi:hypothetical protein
MRVENETGCEVSISDWTGDILCRKPGPDCDCLMTKHDEPEWLWQEEHEA